MKLCETEFLGNLWKFDSSLYEFTRNIQLQELRNNRTESYREQNGSLCHKLSTLEQIWFQLMIRETPVRNTMSVNIEFENDGDLGII